MATQAFGIDIGGSGVKGSLVDLKTGRVLRDPITIPTPAPATPDHVIAACQQLIDQFDVADDVPVGISFPAPIKHGVIPFMANLDQEWVGINAEERFSTQLGRPTVVINDADAAGLAEVRFGAGAGVGGVVIVTTQGTGIGSGMFIDGTLVPNTELGHLEIDGRDAESHASARQKTVNNLTWEQWAERLQRYYSHVEMLFSPDLFVVGGGVSENHDKFLPLLDLKTPIIPAKLGNLAGIIGVACAAGEAAAR